LSRGSVESSPRRAYVPTISRNHLQQLGSTFTTNTAETCVERLLAPPRSVTVTMDNQADALLRAHGSKRMGAVGGGVADFSAALLAGSRPWEFWKAGSRNDTVTHRQITFAYIWRDERLGISACPRLSFWLDSMSRAKQQPDETLLRFLALSAHPAVVSNRLPESHVGDGHKPAWAAAACEVEGSAATGNSAR